MGSIFHSPNGNSPRHAYKGPYKKGSSGYKRANKSIRFKVDSHSVGRATSKSGGHFVPGGATHGGIKKAGVRRTPYRGTSLVAGRKGKVGGLRHPSVTARSRAGTATTFAPAAIAGGVLAHRGARKAVRSIKARRAARAAGGGGGRGIHRDRNGKFA